MCFLDTYYGCIRMSNSRSVSVLLVSSTFADVIFNIRSPYSIPSVVLSLPPTSCLVFSFFFVYFCAPYFFCLFVISCVFSIFPRCSERYLVFFCYTPRFSLRFAMDFPFPVGNIYRHFYHSVDMFC